MSRRHRTFPPKTCAYCQPLPTGREHNPDGRMTPEPLLSGYSSDTIGPLERWMRRMWGLPTGQGLWAEHPSVVRPGLFFGKTFGRRAPGFVKRGVMHETATWEEADRETGSGLDGGTVSKRIGGYREFEKRRGYDLRLHRFDMRQQMRLQFAEGRDDALRSVSLGEDLWHILTVDMSLSRLLMLEIYTEFFFILIGAVLLTLVAAAEGANLDSTLFGEKFLLSFTTVRISTDSVYGWEEKTPSSKPEIIVLALLGWFHWLLLSVAGAIIVTRALKPLQQVAFAPDAIMNDSEISVRLITLRPTVILYDVHVYMKLIAAFKDPETGNYVGALRPIEIAHTKGHYGLFKHFPMTVKHDVTAPDSPLRETTIDHIMLLEVTVTATDNNGNPVFAAANYMPPNSHIVNSPCFQGAYGEKKLYPRLLRGRWRDQMRPFKEANTGAPFKATDMPMYLYNMDDFHVIELEQKADSDDSPV